MPDNLSPEDRIRTMRAVKSQNTSPERRLRAMLAGMGLRGWRVNPKDIVGKPDIAFSRERLAIFVDGCFWHGCPECNRSMPEDNKEYWSRKIERNIQRDISNTEKLQVDGWKVVRIWEHQLKKRGDLKHINSIIKSFIIKPTLWSK
jgi:DNA mismatch endonuclease, patch repair protein